MIRRLRRKFILINMSLVFAVLLVVFAAVCYSSYRRLREESFRAMELILAEESGPLRLRGEPPFLKKMPVPPAAVFSVFLDQEGNLRAVEQRFLEVTEDFAAEAAEQALARPEWSGSLGKLGLRYLKRQSPEGLRIAFADTSLERSSILHLITTSLLVGAGGMGAFFLVSLFLARWALRPVERAWEQQRQFLADASHELKTPLTVILANTSILLTHPEESIDSRRKWIENTRAEAARMKELVNDLLFLAKSDALREPAPHTRISLSDAAWSALLPFEPVAFERGVSIESEIQPDVLLLGDAAQLQQLAAILLDNACKYAGEGGQVSFRLERLPALARIQVRNTGAPIPPEHLPHIFDRFYRADSVRTASDGPGGSGLGLAIAKAITEQHRGRLCAESSPAGTVFTVTLPLPGKPQSGGKNHRACQRSEA